MAANTGVVNITLKVKDDGSVVIDKFGKSIDDIGSKANRSFAGAATSMGAFKSKLSGLGVLAGALGIGVLVAKLADLSMQSIQAASDYEEAHSKFNVVFAGMRAEAEAWATQLTKNYAMSDTEAVRYLSSLQDLLVPMGMARDQAADLSFEMTKLAADLGSFNNVKTADVIADMQSAMVGEYDTMKKYGVILNATIVQEKAMAMGFGNTASQIDSSEKALAAYQIVLESSSAAVGDMIRTGDSYANTTKRMEAAWENFTKTLGQRFLPVGSSVNRILAETLEYWTKFFSEDPIDKKIQKLNAEIVSETEKTKSLLRHQISGIKDQLNLGGVSKTMISTFEPGYIPHLQKELALKTAQLQKGVKTPLIIKLEAEKAELMAKKEAEALEEQETKAAADKAVKDKQAADAASKAQEEARKRTEQAIKDQESALKERARIQAEFESKYRAMGKTTYDVERMELDDLAKKYVAHGAKKVDVDAWVASELARISKEESADRLATVDEFNQAYKEITLSRYAMERMEVEAMGAKYIEAGADREAVERWVAARIAAIRAEEVTEASAAAEERLRASTYWADGAIRALDDYAAHASDMAASVEGLMSNAFSNMEDALVRFVTTGKLSFSDMVTSMLADIARLAIQQSITAPLASALSAGMSSFFGGWAGTGTGSYTSVDGSMTSSWATYNRHGNAFGHDGLHPFAKGGVFTNRVVSQPTVFKFGAGGSFGVMGEAGDEAVMPLTRTPSGDLGVKSTGAAPVVHVTINNQASGAQGRVTATRKNQDGGLDIDVLIEQIDGALAGGISSGRSAMAGTMESIYGLNRAYGANR